MARRRAPRRQGSVLNPNEERLARALARFGVMTLAEAAAVAFPGMGRRSSTRGNSWVRNSLRKLCRYGLVERVDRGTYRWRSPVATQVVS